MVDAGIALLALLLLIVTAYRGLSVIICAPVAALIAVLLTDPSSVPTVFSGLFMERMVSFLKLYLPVFLLGALFGRMLVAAGFATSIADLAMRRIGGAGSMAAIVLVCAILTYGGVSLFVVVFVAYPFAARMFKAADIPKRLIPATIALGAFSFTMDALPGTPQIQNIIPTTVFGTTTWAAPILGIAGSAFMLAVGLFYLNGARRRATSQGEGYGEGHIEEPEQTIVDTGPVAVALLPLVIVFVANVVLTRAIPLFYGNSTQVSLAGLAAPLTVEVKPLVALWAIEAALLIGILSIFALAGRRVVTGFAANSRTAVSGALLAGVNTASEYGFGAVIAALPGFLLVRDALGRIGDPLVREAITVTTLSGMTGSASGGLSIALASMGQDFVAAADRAGIPLEVMHRIASMASGGMDTLPHNGAVITVLAVAGLTHRQSYGGIFAITCLKTAAVALVIGIYHLTGLV